jgi:hypothetical protein
MDRNGKVGTLPLRFGTPYASTPERVSLLAVEARCDRYAAASKNSVRGEVDRRVSGPGVLQ